MIRVATVAAVVALMGIAVCGQETKQLRSALSGVVESRERCASFVGMAKSELHGDDLREARRLYGEAVARNAAWTSLMKAAIREGDAKRLDRDAEYSKLSERASSAASDFVGFVQTKTAAAQGGAKRNIMPLIVPFAQMGLDIWKTYATKKREDRTIAADAFATDAVWKAWEQLGGL